MAKLVSRIYAEALLETAAETGKGQEMLEEIETAEGKEKIELLDVLSSLDGQTEELRKKALFQETLLLGIELGRLRPRDID